jgi:Endoplasmic Reticulum Oxidoreductin 1 (ERO1)
MYPHTHNHLTLLHHLRIHCCRYGPNVEFFTRAVGMHPDRLTNMYFAYLFLLRALAKAAPVLKSYDLTTGHDAIDARTQEMLRLLVDHQQVSATDVMSSAAAVAVSRGGGGSGAVTVSCAVPPVKRPQP